MEAVLGVSRKNASATKLTSFPRDVLARIFLYLSLSVEPLADGATYPVDSKSLGRAACVCKYFKEVVYSSPELWRSVTLPAGLSPVSAAGGPLDILAKFSKYGENTTTVLNIAGHYPDVFRQLWEAQNRPYGAARLFNGNLVDMHVTSAAGWKFEDVRKLYCEQPQSISARARAASDTRVIVIKVFSTMHFSSYLELERFFRTLQYSLTTKNYGLNTNLLYFYSVSIRFTKRTVAAFMDDAMSPERRQRMKDMLVNVKDLQLVFDDTNDSDATHIIDDFIEYAPNLSSVSLKGGNLFAGGGFDYVLRSFVIMSNLRKFSMEGSLISNGDGMAALKLLDFINAGGVKEVHLDIFDNSSDADTFESYLPEGVEFTSKTTTDDASGVSDWSDSDVDEDGDGDESDSDGDGDESDSDDE